MNRDMLFFSLVILLGTFISSISQVLLKKSAEKKYPSKVKEYLNPLVITAYLIFFAATLCSVYAYKGLPLSMGPVLETTSYIYITIFGIKLFHEKINKQKVVALILIITGIIVATL